MTLEHSFCHVIHKNKLLLKLANSGVTKGKWNCPAGKIEKGETSKHAAIRETYEETGLKVQKLLNHGTLRFFVDGKGLFFRIYLFSSRRFSGKIKSSSEGKVKWFDVANIPYGKMWPDDRHWIPILLRGERFDGDFYFDKNNETLLRYEIRFKQ